MKVKQSISIEQELLDQAKKEAAKKNCTLSHIFDRALLSYLNPAPSLHRQNIKHETDHQPGPKARNGAANGNSPVLAGT